MYAGLDFTGLDHDCGTPIYTGLPSGFKWCEVGKWVKAKWELDHLRWETT